MMIDRKAALASAVLVALMLVAAVARIIFLGDLPVPAPLVWQLFGLPAIAAILAVAFYANSRRTIAPEARVQPWYDWGSRLSISTCACVLLIQGNLILRSLGLHVPALVGYAIVLAMVIIMLLAINQMPKLPWFERRFYRGGELGSIYGPKYMRIHSRISILFFITMMAVAFRLPSHLGLYIIVGTAIFLAWTMGLQLYYRRKWRLEQSRAPRVEPESGH